MDSGEGGKGMDITMIFNKVESWLKRTPKLSMAGIVLVALGFLGGVTIGGGFFWFLFFAGIGVFVYEYLQQSNIPGTNVAAPFERDDSPQPGTPPSQASPSQTSPLQTSTSQGSPNQTYQRRVSRAGKVPLVISHWHHLIEGLQDSPQRFYASLEGAISRRQIPGTELSRIDYREGGIFSAKREYFRVRRGEYVFDICAAPFGNSFFVSWWLGELMGCLWGFFAAIPVLGVLMMRAFRPETYYRLDTALMFQELVNSAVLEVVDEITKAKGIRALSEFERKPILSDLFKR
ncbi:MAG: hypothetical protein OS130_10790 [Thermodesulfobacteriota bacterium]|jgi:hypothetical protein|nr:MAG: hypothetical protein OS130_10790 [Thermodesulfobacteriota bacterium]